MANQTEFHDFATVEFVRDKAKDVIELNTQEMDIVRQQLKELQERVSVMEQESETAYRVIDEIQKEIIKLENKITIVSDKVDTHSSALNSMRDRFIRDEDTIVDLESNNKVLMILDIIYFWVITGIICCLYFG